MSQQDKENRAPATVSGDVSTHAQRNPQKPVIPVRKNHVNRSDAEKITAEAKRRDGNEKRELLANDIRLFKEEQILEMKRIAEKHSKSYAYIRGLAIAEIIYKQTRAPNLHNAKLHLMSLDVNKYCEEGEKESLLDMQRRLLESPELNNLTKEEEKAALDLLLKNRDLKKTGMRLNNRAAAVDHAGTVDRINVEIGNLYERTGAPGFFVTSRGHVNDTIVPTMVEAGDVAGFFLEYLNMTEGEFVRKFQSWNDGRSEDSKSQGPSVPLMQKECACAIAEGLVNITKKKAKMAYTRYDENVQIRYGVHLRGWPSGLDFKAPSNLHSLQEIRRLRDALRSGACAWVALTAAEKEEVEAKYADAPKKTRKRRSDLGVKRKAQGDATGSPLSKKSKPTKKKAAKAKAPARSRSVVSSDEDEGADKGAD